MRPYQVDSFQKLYRKYLDIKQSLTGGGKKLFNQYAQGEIIKPLTREQKQAVQNYWKPLVGKEVNTCWHELLYSKTGFFTPRYLPFEVYGEMIARQMPSYKVKSYFDDKSLYRYFFQGFNRPRRIAEACNGICYLPEDGIKEVPFAKVVERCSNIKRCIIKPSKGSSAGIGVCLLNVEKGKLTDTGESIEEKLLSYKGKFVVEELIQESECLSRLNPSSCNTLRIHTWRNSGKERCEYISSYVRIGRKGSIKDNASSGGITCQIMADGRLGNKACTVNPYQLKETTDAGIKLDGYMIEDFEKMVQTAIDAHSCVPIFGIIGWDICLDKDGLPVIIEYNPDPDLRIEQLVFCDTCLLDKQEEIIKEVFD